MELNLHTDRLILRPLCLDDLDLGIEMFTDPDVVRYVGTLKTARQVKVSMHNEIKRCAGGCIGIWCVMDKKTFEKIGTGVLLPMPVDETEINWDLVDGPSIPNADIEVGYILKKSAWGKGYATEICSQLLAFAFTQTPLTEVVATFDDANNDSRKVLLKCGLKDKGRWRAYGEDSPCFRITKQQWLSQHGHDSR